MPDKEDVSLEEVILNHFGVEYDLEAIKKFEKICFVCGLPRDRMTEEDFIPRWLMREFDLAGEKISLPNETLFPFSQCKIPCCQECNNGCLSKIEIEVKKILKKDIEIINQSDENILFKWFMKIFIGLWLKSTLLKADIKKRNSENILPMISLDHAKSLYGLLKTIKYPVHFVNFRPYSIFKFRYSNLTGKPLVLMNDFRFPTIVFAYKKSAFIIALNEDGIIREQFKNMNKAEFSELDFPALLGKFCEVVTAHELTQRIYHYLILHGKELRINKVILPKNEGQPPILPWDVSILAKNFKYYFQRFGYEIIIDEKTGILNYKK